MKRRFNVTGLCIPEKHYMADISVHLEKMRVYIEDGEYFTVNRARQYGKTTTLNALKRKLEKEYTVFLISFEGIEKEVFRDSGSFCVRLMGLLYDTVDFGETAGIPKDIREEMYGWSMSAPEQMNFRILTNFLFRMCRQLDKPAVLMVDETDQAGNYEVFATFLGCLRDMYLKRDTRPVFQSVILAGVYDIKNLKGKIRPEKEHASDSPWNIAADFDIDMSLSVPQIAKMLEEYEADNQTGMDIKEVAEIIYEYTSGYPVLVSSICKQLDEKIIGTEGFETMQKTWTKQGIEKAVSIILKKSSPLFESMVKQLDLYANLYKIVEDIIYCGKKIPFSLEEKSISLGNMFGFLKEENGHVAIANRMFEMCLLNMFMAKEAINSDVYAQGGSDRIGFIKDNMLDMTLVLKKFAAYFTEIYGQNDQKFIEKQGRKIFLIYLKPIINGIGNYYIEAQTRDERRTDIIVDYLGEQFIVELKIWHGSEYNERGEKQLTEYLDYYRKDKGYLLSFNFNKNKETGVKEIQIGNQVIVEAVV